jgi:hypothetical protein
MVPTKNEMIKRPIKIFFIIAISPLIEILKKVKEGSFLMKRISRNYANFCNIFYH